jgi:hypothetical protein
VDHLLHHLRQSVDTQNTNRLLVNVVDFAWHNVLSYAIVSNYLTYSIYYVCIYSTLQCVHAASMVQLQAPLLLRDEQRSVSFSFACEARSDALQRVHN